MVSWGSLTLGRECGRAVFRIDQRLGFSEDEFEVFIFSEEGAVA